MPVPSSNPRWLLLVKQLFDEGRRYSEIGDKLSATKAALLLHLAGEQMLNAIISESPSPDVPDREKMSWNALWRAAKEIAAKNGMPGGIPGFKRLDRLRVARNAAALRGCCEREHVF